MVRALVCLGAALSIVSCGASTHPGDGPAASGSGLGADEGTVRRESDEPERARDDFERAERLAENPIDPARAGVEELLAVPGLSEELARRIAAAAGERDGSNERLTPDEIRELRRCREYLAPAGGSPVRAICRLTERSIARTGEESSDGYLALTGERWRILGRAKRAAGAGDAASCYMSGNLFSGALRLHGGAFVPDYALGLVFGGSGGSSLSSGAFPFRGPGRIAGTTSFFRRTVRGVGAEIRFRNVSAAAFEGMPLTYGAAGPQRGGDAVSGVRIEAELKGAGIGLSRSTGASESAKGNWAIDARWRSERLNAGFEVGFGGSREPAMLWGLSYRVPKTRAGLLLYLVPAGAAGAFGSVLGRDPGEASSIGGAAAAFERELARRIRARASIDRYERSDGSKARLRETVRIECERGGGSHLKIGWIRAAEERRDLVPFPPEGEIEREISRSLYLQLEQRVFRNASAGFTLKRIDGTDGLGWLAAPVLRAALLSSRLRATAALASYRAVRGNPASCYYEPSLRGSYPMRIVSRNAEAGTILISCNISKLELLLHVSLEKDRRPEISAQASVDL